MPVSDIWPGGVTLDTVKEMDSTGGCDSVVSSNSGSSDDSLEHLSPEERACLMFLEETIEALETEDSGLSNDEPLSTRMANLSTSMNHSTNTNTDVCEPVSRISKDHNQILNYLVPTPLVLANGSSSVLSRARKDMAARKESFSRPAVSSKAPPDRPSVPSEVNVVVIPPPVKGNSSQRRARDQAAQRLEASSPRGPLSYQGLMQLRKAASVKKAQGPSQIPGTQDKQPSKPIKHILLDDKTPGAPPDQSNIRKPGPPAVAPKPKKIPSNIPTGATCAQTDSIAADPQKVRMEALYKLGLLKDQELSTGPCPSQLLQSKWFCSPPPSSPAVSSPVPNPPHFKPPLPALSTAEPQTRQTPHWASSVVHHRSLSDLTPSGPQQPLARRPAATGKSATLERCGLGLGSQGDAESYLPQQVNTPPHGNLPQQVNTPPHGNKPRSATLDSRRDCSDSGDGDGGSLLRRMTQESGVKGHVLSQPAVAHSVLMGPRMGNDRREALRKLGLLKD